MKLTTTCLLLLLLFNNNSNVQCQQPSIDDSIVGHLGFAGSYAGISNVETDLQFESISTTHLIHRNNEIFEKLAPFNGNITSTCTLGDDIYFGGDFTTVNRTITANHIIKYNTLTNTFQSLDQGLNGPVYCIYCDTVDSTIYVGGNFTAGISRNAVKWNLGNNSWIELPWKGFNGPVYTITRNKKYNTILFGGRFDATGDGQFFNSNTSQLVPLSSPTSISSGNGALTGTFSNPSNVVCPAKLSPEAEGTPWYLQEGVPGYWDANFVNPIQPTVFRLSNTQTDRGTISFNILSLGLNEFYNLSYVDPVTQQTIQCSTDCILSNNTYQDFTVVDAISASGIRININSWYGAGGGLSYVQVFQSDIAVNPHLTNNSNSQCNPTTSATQTTITGNWEEVYVYGYYQTVLQTNMPYSQLATSGVSIVYEPNIPAQGQYDVYATTPGCVGSSNCFQRTQVEYQLQLSPGVISTVVSDQNTFSDRRTLLYSGFISPVSSSFRPSITLKPALNATQPEGENVSIMADTIEFVRNVTAPPLVSILEYTPLLANASDNTTVSWKPLNQQLPVGSTVYSIDASSGDVLYIGGQFQSASNTTNALSFQNIVSYSTLQGQLIALDSNFTTSSSSSGLNGKVSTVLLQDSTLFVGGEFNASLFPSAGSLMHVAQFDTTQKSWSGLGNGLDGPVNHIFVASNSTLLTVSGSFNHRYEPTPRTTVGNALWDMSQKVWIERASLIVGTIEMEYNNYFAGALLGAQTYRADLVTKATDFNHTAVVFDQSGTVVTAGVIWMNNLTRPYQPITIIASLINGTTTVSIYNNNQTWTPIDTFKGDVNTLAVFNNKLMVGGFFQAAQNRSASLSMYDLAASNKAVALSGVFDANGGPGTVNTIKIHPDGKRIVIGGQFAQVGMFDCDAVCVMDPNVRQWNKLALGLSGTVYDIIASTGQDTQKITAVGDLTTDNNPTIVATLSESETLWTMSTKVDTIPGIPITAIDSTNNELLVSGRSSSNPSTSFVGAYSEEGGYRSINENLGEGTNISQLLLVPVSSSSDQLYPADTQNMLMAVGHLNITNFGNASAALYDGKTWHPYLLTTQINGQPGIIHQIIHPTDFNGIRQGHKYLSVAAVILISIAISVGILFAISALGLLFLFKEHKKTQGANAMAPWKPSNRFTDTLGLLSTGTLGASAIAATAPTTSAAAIGAGAGITSAFAAGPSNAAPRNVFQHDDVGDIGVSPTATMVNPIPISAAAAAAGILSFESMVAAAKANRGGVVSEANPKLFYAKYPFKAQEYGELSLEAGDTIVVTDTTDNIWWLGYKNSESSRPISGVFPSNYVKP